MFPIFGVYSDEAIAESVVHHGPSVLNNVRLSQGNEGIMVDSGAFGNLGSSCFLERMRAILLNYGLDVSLQPMGKPLQVAGVGSGASRTDVFARIPGAVTDSSGVTRRIIFEAPIIPNSDLPALWGRESLTQHRAVIDMVGQNLVLCGPGDWRGGPPPASWILPMYLSPSGHLLVPITHFESAIKQGIDLKSGLDTVRTFCYDTTEKDHPDWSSHIPFEADVPKTVSFKSDAEEIILLADSDRPYSLTTTGDKTTVDNYKPFQSVADHKFRVEQLADKDKTTTKTTQTQTNDNNDSEPSNGGDGGPRHKDSAGSRRSQSK